MHRFLESKTAQYMTPSIVSVTRQVTMRELETLFEKYDFNSFPVVEERRLLGIVTKLDFLRTFVFTTGAMMPHYDALMQRTVAEMMTVDVVHIGPDAPLTHALEMMVNHKVRSLPVMSQARELLGMISRTDIIRALKDATCTQ